jgi:hypothetical protein
MKESENASKGIAIKAPIGALGVAAALALAGAAYTYFSRGEQASENGLKAKTGGMRRRLSFMTLIALIENDTTRKLLVAALRAMSKRS